MTGIAWTERVWNPVTGCDRVSPGCDRCYALTMARRLKAMGKSKYQQDGNPVTSGPGFGVAWHEDVLLAPLRWRKPRRVFVNSMSDLFHGAVPTDFIVRVLAVIAATPEHTYQVLTKRHGRMHSALSHPDLPDQVEEAISEFSHTSLDRWPLPNLQLGVSAEDQQRAEQRIPLLLDTPAAVRWVSLEPLLSGVNLTRMATGRIGGPVRRDALRPVLDRRTRATLEPALSWVVIGGESGPGARPMAFDWAADIVRECRDAGVPVFVKQLGTVLGGRQHTDIGTFPDALQVREYPDVTL